MSGGRTFHASSRVSKASRSGGVAGRASIIALGALSVACMAAVLATVNGCASEDEHVSTVVDGGDAGEPGRLDDAARAGERIPASDADPRGDDAGSADVGAASEGRRGDAGAGGRGLVHPGGLLLQRDLDAIRSNVAAGREPWASAWLALQRSTSEGVNYQPSVGAVISDDYALQNQGHAAFVLAMKWVASGDVGYAKAAERVLDAWVNGVTSMTTTTLRTGIGAVQFANAAEIMAHGFAGAAGWPPAQVAKAQAWMKTVVWSRIGNANAQRSSNWGTSAMAGCTAAAIFADDRVKFDYAVSAYQNGFTDAPDGCSGVAQYICNAAGQPTEAGRDQAHPQGGVGHLVEVALMAWNQGLDLVSYADQRLVAGMEYLAKYNLGDDDVPYDPNFPDPCNVHPNNWFTISPTGRGTFSPVYETAHRLFTLAGAAHPYTTRVIGTAGYVPEATSSDHCGMGTLAFR